MTLSIGMFGTEWFEERPGGLSRYFEGLFHALLCAGEASVAAWAFGAPAPGGNTWGTTSRNVVARALSSRGRLRPFSIVDRHFALYGPSARMSGAVKVCHFHGPWAEESEISGASDIAVRAKMVVERRRYHTADHIITLSGAFKSLLVDKYNISASKVSVIPPGVMIASAPTEITSLPNRVVVVRRLESRMGIDYLLKAWRLVQNQVPTAVLHIVGDGAERGALENLSGRLGLGPSVQFLGRVSEPELLQEYRSATVSVVPSIALEGYGLIALESLSQGTPAIVTDCGGLPDSVQGLDASLVIPRANEDALATRILAAFNGSAPSGSRCVQHASQFSWANVAQRHLDLYKGLSR